MSKPTNENITITVKHTIHKNTITAIVDFFEVTTKRARDMLTTEIARHGMTQDSVFVVGQSNNSLAYEIRSSLIESRELARAYTNHQIIKVATGERLAMRPSVKGKRTPEFEKVKVA